MKDGKNEKNISEFVEVRSEYKQIDMRRKSQKNNSGLKPDKIKGERK